MVSNAGLTTVVLSHSPADKLAEAQDYATPFDLVSDAEKKIFRAYAVERGLHGLSRQAKDRESPERGPYWDDRDSSLRSG